MLEEVVKDTLNVYAVRKIFGNRLNKNINYIKIKNFAEQSSSIISVIKELGRQIMRAAEKT